MSVLPPIDSFAESYSAGQPQVVWTRIVADMETPVSAMLKLSNPREPAFLLESVEGGEVRGRYSVIGLEPDLVWRCFGSRAEINPFGTMKENDFEPCEERAMDSLRILVDACRIEIPGDLPPMAAGLIGYLGYDIVRQMEHLPAGKPDTLGIPDACLLRPTIMAIFDSVAGAVFIITPVWPSRRPPLQEYRAAENRIARILRRLAAPVPSKLAYQPRQKRSVNFTSNMKRAAYHEMIVKAKSHIRAGDIFQVVPSQRFSAEFTLPPLALYRALRHLNPSPFLFYLNFGGFSLVGASPEILVRARAGNVTIRPIAGTRKRGKTREEDNRLAEELLADPKELAEHLMLLDLGRNDVGRVARPGSVRVTERMVIERYSHVMHIVSNVEGKLREDAHPLDALAAGFPAGTVSGAPKIRAMEIIDALEPICRSFYGGCVGYFSANGDMDSCIALRTALVKDGRIYVQSGGGVVADSDPQAEYEETLNKAKALMRAGEEAICFSGTP